MSGAGLRTGLVWASAATAVLAVALWVFLGPLTPGQFGTLSKPPPGELAGYGVVLALLGAGVCLIALRAGVQWTERLAVLCVIAGAISAAATWLPAEVAFSQAFPDDGAGSGWTPQRARAEFLLPFYWVALMQFGMGLLCAGALLLLLARRRGRQATL